MRRPHPSEYDPGALVERPLHPPEPDPGAVEGGPTFEAIDRELQRMGRLGTRAIEGLQDVQARDPSLWERVKFHVGDTAMQLYELAMTASGVTAARAMGRAAEHDPRFLLPAVAFGLGLALTALHMEKVRQVRAKEHPGRP